jgi:hypothetical protein
MRDVSDDIDEAVAMLWLPMWDGLMAPELRRLMTALESSSLPKMRSSIVFAPRIAPSFYLQSITVTVRVDHLGRDSLIYMVGRTLGLLLCDATALGHPRSGPNRR